MPYGLGGKFYSFFYRNELYESNTKVLFNGKCYLGQREVFLDHKIVTYLYTDRIQAHFSYLGSIYNCHMTSFENHIIKIIIDKPKREPVKQDWIDWTDDMVAKTIWYIVIMVVGVLFKDRILIWIFATFFWYKSTFKK